MPLPSRARALRTKLPLVALALAALACASGGSRTDRSGLPGASQENEPLLEGEISTATAGDAGVPESEDSGTKEDVEESNAFGEAMAAIGRHDSGAEPPLGLRFGVVERGPGKRWLLALLNEGDSPVRVIADQRLLWFELEVPGKRTKKATCRLPGALFPTRIDHRAEIVLDPGQAIADSFDPRLYCFGAKGQNELVPGAVVKPFFGWPEKKVPARRGKAAEGPAPPFVATPATVITGRNARVPTQDELCDSAESGCIKLLEGQPFGLRSEYKAWSSARLEEDDKLRENPGPIELVLTQGSDAEAERNATVTLAVKNRTKHPIALYFRRELVSFEVVGPDGTVTCDPEPDQRAPERQAFERLAKGGSLAATSRLVELCPSGALARPGLYLVHARFDANQRGDEFNLDAFVGRVVSLAPAAVRVKTGELPFQRAREIRRALPSDE
jgi:hypothetical protein